MYVPRVHKVVNPSRKRRKKPAKSTRAKNARHRTRKPNPAHMVTLGFVNPKRRKSVAKRRRRATARRATNASRARRTYRRRPNTHHRRRARRNPTRVVVMHRRHNRRRASRNPFGQTPTKIAEAVGGIILGGTAVTMVYPMLPASITSSTLGALAGNVAVAFGAGWIAGMVSKDLGFNVMLGGMAVAASKALADAVPSLKTGLSGLRGFGDFVPGRFVVPQNPVMDANTGLPTGGALMSSAYPAPYGRAA